jgi:hypothetical protein
LQQLWDESEMAVAGDEYEFVLESQSGYGSFELNAGPCFFQDYERNPDRFACRQTVGEPRTPSQQVDKPIGIEGDPHFHLSGSIWRCEATTSSKAASAVHFPTRSLKSARFG